MSLQHPQCVICSCFFIKSSETLVQQKHIHTHSLAQMLIIAIQIHILLKKRAFCPKWYCCSNGINKKSDALSTAWLFDNKLLKTNKTHFQTQKISSHNGLWIGSKFTLYETRKISNIGIKSNFVSLNNILQNLSYTIWKVFFHMHYRDRYTLNST